MTNNTKVEPTIETPPKPNKMLEGLEFRYEMASYISKLLGLENPFRKDFNPPAKVAKVFHEAFNKWLESYLASIVKDEAEEAVPEVLKKSAAWEFSPEEWGLLKNFLNNLKTKVGPPMGAPSGRARMVPAGRSVRTNPPITQAPATLATPETFVPPPVGTMLYLMDSSVFNSPDIMTGDAVKVVGANGENISVALARKPTIQFTTTISNLSKEKI